MYHLRLMKGLSYSGAVSATKDHPDVYVEDEKRYQAAMKSGYFEEISCTETVDDTDVDPSESQECTEKEASGDSLDDMSQTELKAYASLNGIDITGLKKKEDIVKAIRNAEAKADEIRAVLRSE